MKLITAFLFIIANTAVANDRASDIQAKLVTAIGSIVSKSDFLIVVNKTDQLEDGGQSKLVSGSLKNLPGLNVGVDEKGQVVARDSGVNQYNGPVVITLLVDNAVQEETFNTLKQMLPEIAGGLRDLDEFKVRRAKLRQTNVPNQNAPVNVNNIMPQKPESQWSDSLKFFSILLLVGGLFAWLLSRLLMNKQSSPASSSPNRESAGQTNTDKETPEEKVNWDFDPTVVGLYLIKSFKEKKYAPILTWSTLSTSQFQRQVLLSLPAWMSSYLQSNLDTKDFFGEIAAEPIGSVFREITILEQNLSQNHSRKLAFLQWFPAPALRHVPKHFQKSFTAENRKTLWTLRPDLGDFVNVGNINIEDLKDSSDHAISLCFEELAKWPSTAVIKNKDENRDIVVLLVNQLDMIREFGPLQAQIEHAQKSLSAEDYSRFLKLTASIETPLSWDQTKLREWLRQVEPQDYFWWLSLLKTKPSWKLENELRPMRKAMFQLAESNPYFQSWSEAEKKEASARMLDQLRSIHRGSHESTSVVSA